MEFEEKQSSTIYARWIRDEFAYISLKREYGESNVEEEQRIRRELQIPEFNGRNCHDWIKEMEDIFYFFQLNEMEKMKVIIMSLVGEALWWFTEEQQRRPFCEWPELKRLLVMRFGSKTAFRLTKRTPTRVGNKVEQQADVEVTNSGPNFFSVTGGCLTGSLGSGEVMEKSGREDCNKARVLGRSVGFEHQRWWKPQIVLEKEKSAVQQESVKNLECGGHGGLLDPHVGPEVGTGCGSGGGPGNSARHWRHGVRRGGDFVMGGDGAHGDEEYGGGGGHCGGGTRVVVDNPNHEGKCAKGQHQKTFELELGGAGGSGSGGGPGGPCASGSGGGLGELSGGCTSEAAEHNVAGDKGRVGGVKKCLEDDFRLGLIECCAALEKKIKIGKEDGKGNPVNYNEERSAKESKRRKNPICPIFSRGPLQTQPNYFFQVLKLNCAKLQLTYQPNYPIYFSKPMVTYHSTRSTHFQIPTPLFPWNWSKSLKQNAEMPSTKYDKPINPNLTFTSHFSTFEPTPLQMSKPNLAAHKPTPTQHPSTTSNFYNSQLLFNSHFPQTYTLLTQHNTNSSNPTFGFTHSHSHSHSQTQFLIPQSTIQTNPLLHHRHTLPPQEYGVQSNSRECSANYFPP